ncbi:hypothetical protein VW29_18265 [Devosia limi DSM 17137]|uniref:Inhibitor of g-type lysozyme n=1 Tax=Devosia limi DSM 17137 TaxID=1121477 RepID=A0A0F5L4G8_9HYPH|nr:hypothetical protein [Devosia limi]KKB77311.1 hypothetical protein VW29_18265 [Devosia limi DSM 17137]SHE65678.1 hypothetical protein SAMN02745223_00810 [Devosia limi DSM 17137]
MRSFKVMLAAMLMGSVAPIMAQTSEVVAIADAATTSVEGTISGEDYIDYVVSAKAGQVLSAGLTSVDKSVNFNVLPPQGDEALFTGSIYGTDYVGRIPEDGDYTIRVYQMGAAASEGLDNDFTLELGLDVESLPEQEDAIVEGTDYNATGTLPCTFEANPDAPECTFGVRRAGDGAASVFVTTPNGFVRQLDFAADGKVTAPGSDAPIEAVVQGEDTVVNINKGEEVYRVKDIIVLGD